MKLKRRDDSTGCRGSRHRTAAKEDGNKNAEAGNGTTRLPPTVDEPAKQLAILVMGITGSGKSTFISRLTTDDVTIGHSLESCTANVGVYEVTRPSGEVVNLIDTPGFDDTQASDVDLLRKIASALDAIYGVAEVQLVGMIYMHRITDQRVAGSSLKSMRIFEKICGENNFHCVTIVTTMWNLLGSEEGHDDGLDRESTLKDKDEFLGRMIRGGAEMVRDCGEHRTAGTIVDNLAKRRKSMVTALQRELAEPGKTLEDTTVGAFLSEHLEQARRKYEVAREELEEALEEAKRERDEDLIVELSDDLLSLKTQVAGRKNDEKILSLTKADLELMRKEWIEEVKKETEQQKEQLAEVRNMVHVQGEQFRSLQQQSTLQQNETAIVLEQQPAQQQIENRAGKPKKKALWEYITHLFRRSVSSIQSDLPSRTSYARSQSIERFSGHVAVPTRASTWNTSVSNSPQTMRETPSVSLPYISSEAIIPYPRSRELMAYETRDVPIRQSYYQGLPTISQAPDMKDIGIGRPVAFGGPKRDYANPQSSWSASET